MLIAALVSLLFLTQADQVVAPAAPDLMERLLTSESEREPEFAAMAVRSLQWRNPEAQICPGVLRSERVGILGPNVSPDNFYSNYVGALVYSVQCGAFGEPPSSLQHWLVVVRPGATAPEFVNCADANGADRCATRPD